MAASAVAAASATGREPEPPVDGVAGEAELGVVLPLVGNVVSGVVVLELAMKVSGSVDGEWAAARLKASTATGVPTRQCGPLGAVAAGDDHPVALPRLPGRTPCRPVRSPRVARATVERTGSQLTTSPRRRQTDAACKAGPQARSCASASA
jgi:hypothetical protein